MAEKRDAAADAARESNLAEQRNPSTSRDPGAIATPSVAVEVAQPGAELRAFDPPEGEGQKLNDAERARMMSDAELAEARRKADEDYQKAQAAIRERHRTAVGSQIDEQRAAAREEIDAQRKELRANHPQVGGLTILNPVAMEIEGALVRSEAAALQIDETIPGGVYVVAGQMVDAHGNVLGKAK
jgi:hypothetical protein